MQSVLRNSYAKYLPELSKACLPSGFKKPEIILKNYELGEELGFSKKFLDSDECLNIFSGNALLEDSTPIAQAYSGHQFGQFNPNLGDGRAILLGEINNLDIQLKGIGQTPFSRRGDGKSALGPVLREYIISEFMHTAGIPTTRALFALKTNESVLRDTELPGGILTRVANSHIRIGTFQYAAMQGTGVLKKLADYSISRHYPELKNADDRYLKFFAAVCQSQTRLVSRWMNIGFIHGVMNTDNITISGETIDYGPCAFMDYYDQKTVFSSIDVAGRYCYGNQPAILVWNLSKLAEALIPIIDDEEQKSIEKLTEVLQLIMPSYEKYFYSEMGKKLGIDPISQNNMSLIKDYLKILDSNSIDFTLSFRDLSKILKKTKSIENSVFKDSDDFKKWTENWIIKIISEKTNLKDITKKMDLTNPCFIPRNHIIEDALENAVNGDMAMVNEILQLFKNPFDENGDFEVFKRPSKANEPYVTFCGT